MLKLIVRKPTSDKRLRVSWRLTDHAVAALRSQIRIERTGTVISFTADGVCRNDFALYC